MRLHAALIHIRSLPFLEVEEQRRYLGGDADHTVLVKGLDFALLEQQKADYETMITACMMVEKCVGMTLWDYTDR